MANLLEGLTDEQRQSVTHEGGPLIVLAGPGTGKTRVITHRVAHMILERNIEPESIVAVTYTVKAAAQLKDKLRELIGSDAQRVQAHTFHGLGLSILRRFADSAGLPPISGQGGAGNLIIDESQQRRHMRAIIREHALFPRLHAEGARAVAQRVLGFAEALGNSGLVPSDVHRFLEGAHEQLRSRKDGLGRELDDAGVKAQALKLEDLKQLARALELFQTEYRARGELTYDDLIVLPSRLLKDKQRPMAGAIIRDEWRHFVVDEFQDVNPAQIAMLKALAPPASSRLTAVHGAASTSGPDVCVVGDDDQAIYGFRGADDRSFAHFAKLWAPVTQVNLTINHRSTKHIVAIASGIIEDAAARFAPDKTLDVPTHKLQESPALAPKVRCVHLEDHKDDGEVIASMIHSDRRARPDAPWSSYAVVVRSGNTGEDIRAALTSEGIPVSVARAGNPAEDAGVQDILAWTRLLAHPSATYAGVRLLLRPPVRANPALVQAMESSYRALRSRHEAGEPGTNDPGSFVDWIATSAGDDPAIRAFVSRYEALRAYAMEHSAAQSLFRICVTIDAAHADLLAQGDRLERVRNLVALMRFARQRQDRLEQPGDLRAFLEYFDDLAQSEKELAGARAVDDDAADRIDSDDHTESESAADGGVVIITAHSAKGLEFDTVFVPRVSPQRGYPISQPRLNETDLPVGLRASAGLMEDVGEIHEQASRAMDEERRVFFVACTRAERSLVLLAKKNKSPSKSEHFFEQLARKPALQESMEVLDGPRLLASAASEGVLDQSRRGVLGALAKAAGHRRMPETLDDLFRRALARARSMAASALDSASLAQDAGGVDQAVSALARSARLVSGLEYIRAFGDLPLWARELRESDQPMYDELASVLERVRTHADESTPRRARSAPTIHPSSTPLRLSYSRIDKYQRCPRCYYTRYVMKLEPLADSSQVVGQAVHEALELFYRRVQAHDSTGAAPVDTDVLMTLGRDSFFRKWPRSRQVDRSQLDQVLAQLNICAQELIDPNAHVLEIERQINFPYHQHTFEARLDRLDQFTLDSGAPGFRIVDYKTGKPLKSLREVKPDDLQMGIYAMALAHAYPGEAPDVPPPGVAEYRILQTGEVGPIDLAAINLVKVRKQIDETIDGIVSCRWEKGKQCQGDCDILGADHDAP